MMRIKCLMGQYKGFTGVLLLEAAFLIVLVISSLGRRVTIELDSDDLIINDQKVMTGVDGTLSIGAGTDEGSSGGGTGGSLIVSSGELSLQPGVYELEAVYSSQHDSADGEERYGDRKKWGGVIQLASAKDPSSLQYKALILSDGRTSAVDRFWIRSLTEMDDLKVDVFFYGEGTLSISRIVIRELLLWRLARILIWLLLSVLMDAAYLYFFTRNDHKDKMVTAGLILTIFFSSLPLFADMLFFSHDVQFHVLRILALAEGIQDGHWIAPIQTGMLNGYGYASPLFYSPFFLYVPALLYCLAVPLQVCYQAYVFMINMATCLICYHCVKATVGDKRLAMFGSFLYTMAPYRISNIYVRAAVGEFTAMAFFPLVCLGFARVYMAEEGQITWRDYLPIVFGLSGIIQCHVLSCEMAAFFIAALCILWIRRTLQPRRLLALIKAALLTVCLNAAFLIPFVSSMRMDLVVRHADINKIQQHGTYLLQVLGFFMPPSYGLSGGGMAGEMPMVLGPSLMMGMVVLLYCCAEKYEWGIERDGRRYLGAACLGAALACIVFSMRIFPWDSIRNISPRAAKVACMIQFPWRYLALATVFGLFASVTGLALLYEHKGARAGNACCLIMAALTVLNIGLFYMHYADEMGTDTVYGSGLMDIGLDLQIVGREYLPAGTSIEEMDRRQVLYDEALVTVSQYDDTSGAVTFWCANRADAEELVEIPLLAYDNYHAYDLESGGELEIRNGSNNRVGVVVGPHHQGRVQVRYEIPLLWEISYAVSALTLAGIIAGVRYDLKKRSEKLAERRGADL